MAQYDIGNLIAHLRLDGAQFHAMLNTTEKKLLSASQSWERMGRSLTMKLTLPLLALGGYAVKTSISMESAFAGVRKTVDATEEQFAKLESGFKDLSLQIPLSVESLMGVGEAAGQLGVARENILGFTDVMAKLGVTTNMTAQDSAMSVARFTNITGLAQTEVDHLGSTIVDLGNNLATTEGEIVSMSLRIAAAGKIAGMAESEILSIAGALSSVGVEAQVGGTSIQKVLINMTKAVTTGNKQLKLFAEVAGQTSEEFTALFKTDAAEAFTSFIEGLGNSGDAVFEFLDTLELSDQRVVRSLLSIGNAGELLRESMELGNKAWKENTALNIEAGKRFDTTASKLRLFWNEVRLAAASFEDALIPALMDVVDGYLKPMAQALRNMDEATRTLTMKMGLFAISIGPVLYAVAKLTQGLIWCKIAVMALWGSLVLPVTLAVGAFAALVAAVSVATGESKTFRDGWKGFWQDQSDGLKAATTDLGSLVEAWKTWTERKGGGGGDYFGGAEQGKDWEGSYGVYQTMDDGTAQAMTAGQIQRAKDKEIENNVILMAQDNARLAIIDEYNQQVHEQQILQAELSHIEKTGASQTMKDMLGALDEEIKLINMTNEGRQRGADIIAYQNAVMQAFPDNQEWINKKVQEYKEKLQKIVAIEARRNIKEMNAALEFEYNMLGKMPDERQRALKIAEYQVEVEKQFSVEVLKTAEGQAAVNAEMAIYKERLQDIADGQRGVSAFTIKMNQWVSDATNLWENLGDVAIGAMDGLADTIATNLEQGTANWKAFGASVLQELNRMIIKMMLAKILTAGMGMLGGGGQSAVGAPGGNPESGSPTMPDFSANAMGNIFNLGKITPMAKGFITSGPTMAPMALMGEAGPEAVMPLARGADGKLGVRAQQSSQPGINFRPIIKNIMVKDEHEAVYEAMRTPKGEHIIIQKVARNKRTIG